MPLITVPFIKKLKQDNILIFDLGMPRNCDKEIDRLNNVKLVDMENLLSLSKEYGELLENDLQGVYEIINDDLRKIIFQVNKNKQYNKIISQQMELT